jgi:hypothetical protein
MPVITGRTGADAMYKFIRLMLSTMTRYRAKFLAFADDQWSLGHITADQNTRIHAFVDSLADAGDILKILADFTNVR